MMMTTMMTVRGNYLRAEVDVCLGEGTYKLSSVLKMDVI